MPKPVTETEVNDFLERKRENHQKNQMYQKDQYLKYNGNSFRNYVLEKQCVLEDENSCKCNNN